MKSCISIVDTFIGTGYPVYIIAEISANHRQQFDEAVKLVETAKEAGADAVKLQTYTPDTLTTQCDKPEFRIGGGTPWDGKTLYELYSEAYMPWEWQPKLKKLADDLGIDLLSTPYDKTAVDFLDNMGVPAYKVASFEIVDIPLTEYIASKGKPIILSTGMATLEEIEEAVQAVRKAGGTQIALLKCTSAYPAPPEEMNLRTIPDLAKKFRVPVGLSDHTATNYAIYAAVALGAVVVEKHLAFSRLMYGSDARHSLEPDEFADLVKGVRAIETMLNSPVRKDDLTPYAEMKRIFEKSLVANQDIPAGTLLSAEMVAIKKPGTGISAARLHEFLGRVVSRDVKADTLFSEEDF